MRRNIHAQKILVFAILLFSWTGACFADGLPDSLALSFRRVTAKGDASETLEATAYYRAAPHFFCLEVTKPIHQLIFYNPKHTLVYYPDTARALRIANSGGNNDSEERGIAVLFGRDKGLAASGYRMDTIKPLTDGAESVWSPPEALSGAVRSARVTTDAADRILSIETTAVSGTVIQEAVYAQYGEKMAGLPSSVTTRVFLSDGSVAVETRLTILSATESPVPARFLNFRIPETVKIEDLSW